MVVVWINSKSCALAKAAIKEPVSGINRQHPVCTALNQMLPPDMQCHQNLQGFNVHIAVLRLLLQNNKQA
jgi:hypothetical protein